MRKRDNDKLSPVASEPISATNQAVSPRPSRISSSRSH